MGVDIVTWRSRIGSFSQPFKASKWKISAITLGEKASRIRRFFVLLVLLYTSLVYSGELTENLYGTFPTTTDNGTTQVWLTRGIPAVACPWQTMTESSDHVYLVTETNLLRGGIESNPGPDNHCIEKCTKGRKDTGNMIRCCLCAQWFHLDCLRLPESEASGVWPCLDCREVGQTVRTMSENLTNLSTALSSINERLETLTTTLQAEKDTLKQESIDLRRQLNDA